MTFRFYPLRFRFKAREAVHFPVGKPGNVLRGGFGAILKRLVCVPHCRDVKQCELADRCAYSRMFEPRVVEGGPSGFADWPRPFVFRAAELDGRTVERGEEFWFDLNLFDLREPAIAYLVVAFGELGREGMGPGRGRAELMEVRLRGEERTLFDGRRFVAEDGVRPMEVGLEAESGVERVVVRFLTATELKSGDGLAARPEFGALAGRARDRVAKLRELYGDGPLEMDFRGFGERARVVRMTRCEVREVFAERRSGRTGQVHSLGGFVGEAEYEGDLGEFVPFLRAAAWTGVGRQTVWGKGVLEVQ